MRIPIVNAIALTALSVSLAALAVAVVQKSEPTYKAIGYKYTLPVKNGQTIIAELPWKQAYRATNMVLYLWIDGEMQAVEAEILYSKE